MTAFSDLAASLLSALDVPGFANPLDLDPVGRVLLLVVDGLGWELLQANREQAPFLTTGFDQARVLTAGFPAATVTSLGSLGTGRPPGEHGLVGTTMAMPGHQHAMNCLRWATYGPGPRRDLRDTVVPEQLQPEPTAFERAAADGVQVSLVGPRDHAHSGLTRAVLRGGSYRNAASLGDLGGEAARHLTAGRRTLVYAYHRDLDITGHARGVASLSWRLQLRFIDDLVERLVEWLPGGSLLVVTGDHGMVDLAPAELVDVDEHPELAAGVRLLTGEARARHVHTVAGAARDVLTAWRALVGDRMWVVSREQAIADGWFGPQVLDRVRERIGDVVAAAHGRIGIVQRAVDPGQAAIVGHHGSMTDTEQLVPLLLKQI